MNRKLESEKYVSELFDDGRINPDRLRSDERNKLTGLLMREANQWRGEFIYESQHFEKVMQKLINYLISFNGVCESMDRLENISYAEMYIQNVKYCAEELLEALVECATSYAESYIEKAFSRENEERCRWPADFYDDCNDDMLSHGRI